jgi:hypothetical protein
MRDMSYPMPIKFITILILFFSLSIRPSLCIGNEASLTLLHTSNTLGEVEPCETCPESGNVVVWKGGRL